MNQESDEHFRALVQATSDVVYRMNADWTVMHHLKGRDFIADSHQPTLSWFEKYIHPDDQQQVAKSIKDAILAKQPFQLEHRVLRVDGTWGWTLSRAVPIFDNAGEIVEWLGAASDISARKEAAEQLRISEERSVFVRRSSGIGFWYCDLPFDVLRWDDLVKSHFHLPPDAHVTIETFYDRIHQEDREPTRLAIEQSIADHIPYNVEYRTISPEDGSLKWIRAIGRTFYDQDGNPIRFDGVTLDVTEQKEAEAARDASQKKLREQEQRYRALFEEVDEGFCIIEFLDGPHGPLSDYVHIEANPAYARQAGIPNVLGQKLREMVPNEADDWIARYRPVLETGQPTRFEQTLHATGRHLELAAFRIEPRERRQVAVLFKDITERWRTEKAIRDSEQRYRLVADASNDAIWDWNLISDEVTWNEGMQTRFGYSVGQIVPSAAWWYEHIHAEDRDGVVEGIHAAIDGGKSEWSKEYRFLRANGSPAYVFDRGRIVRDENGKPIRMVGSMLDLTERKQAEQTRERLLEESQHARAEAETANRMKDEFLATLSHELRTPLNAILGWATLLKSEQLDQEEQKEGLDIIERNSKIQAQLIEDLLDVSRIISGKLRLDIQQVALPEVIDAALAAVIPAADARDIRIQKVLDDTAGPVTGDPARLQQVMWNLLSNAVKFTPKGGKVLVLLERVNSHIEISVNDTGQGISPDFLPHVFDRFRQADGSTTRRFGGLGLGLSIARQLVELHGGSVRAKSPGEGQGSTFIVSLPLAIVRELPHSHTQATGLLDGEVQKSSALLKGVKVLAVDDEPDAIRLMSKILSDCGALVRTASSADGAIISINEIRPDLLISDIGMPGRDGYELIREIRTRGYSAKELPAVALTAFARSEDRRRSMLAGFQMHLAKPVEPEELVAVVASLVGRTGKVGK
jgi:PAS domain S-box-containing protein